MKPLAPEVVGPLSVCSASLEVRGNITGATIEIQVEGNTVSSHVSKTPDEVYPIGVALQANQSVTARQTISGATSPPSLPIIVQAAPSQLSALTVGTLLHSCGRAIRLTGAVPGAKVDVLAGSQVVGAHVAVKGWVGITYDPGGPLNGPLTVKQITCNGLKSTQTTGVPVAQPAHLPAPLVQSPLFECQGRVTIGGVVPGAYVELYRNNSSTPEDRYLFSVSEEWRWIKPLVKNDVIKVRQGFSCKQPAPPLETTSPFTTVTVQPVSSLHAPKFLSAPCPGSTFVTLGHLVPGARVILSQNGDELGETDAPDVAFTFPTPALKGGATLEAHMEMCNGKGPSASITVGTQPLTTGLALSPPYACASFVAMNANGAVSNFLVFITNKDGQQISPYHNLIGTSTLVPVFPSLVAGDKISVHVQGCGGDWVVHGPITVLSGPPPPTIQLPLYAGYNRCDVVGMAGFVLDVFVNNVWRGTAMSEGIYLRSTVALSAVLHVGDAVTCTMTVCGVVSKPTSPVTVVQQPPEAPELLQPPNGASNVALQPTFQWKDPGAGTPAAATSYQLVVTTGNSTVINEPATTASHVSAVVLAHSTSYQWTVTSTNSGGHTAAAAPFHFTTLAPPPPPAAVLKLIPPISAPAPFPRGVQFAASIDVVNQGNATSGGYAVKFTQSAQDGTLLADPVTIPMPALAAGAHAPASAAVLVNDPNTVRIDVFLLVNNQPVDQAFRVG